jgi:hypothetical protein
MSKVLTLEQSLANAGYQELVNAPIGYCLKEIRTEIEDYLINKYLGQRGVEHNGNIEIAEVVIPELPGNQVFVSLIYRLADSRQAVNSITKIKAREVPLTQAFLPAFKADASLLDQLCDSEISVQVEPISNYATSTEEFMTVHSNGKPEKTTV